VHQHERLLLLEAEITTKCESNKNVLHGKTRQPDMQHGQTANTDTEHTNSIGQLYSTNSVKMQTVQKERASTSEKHVEIKHNITYVVLSTPDPCTRI